MLLPSGVSSAPEASAASWPTSAGRELAEGNELRGAAIADGNGAGLIEQERIDVAGHFDGLAAFGDDIGPQGPVHARNADGCQEGADGRRYQADQQGDEGWHIGAEAGRHVPADR